MSWIARISPLKLHLVQFCPVFKLKVKMVQIIAADLIHVILQVAQLCHRLV